MTAWEPTPALFAGDDGLDDIRVHRRRSSRATWATGGWLVLEIGSTQGTAVAALLHERHFRQIEIRQDLAGHDRIAIGRWSRLDQPKRTATSARRVFSCGVTSASTPATSRAAENSALRRTLLLIC